MQVPSPHERTIPLTCNEFSLRLAVPADAQCLSVLATHVFSETYARSGIRAALAREVESQFSASVFLKRLGEPSRRITLAEVAGHLVAFSDVVIGACHPLVGSIASAELTRLYVQSPFQRQGIGSLLLRRAEALAYAGGASTLWLTALVGNQRALEFYASQGYEQLGRTAYAFEGEAFENRLFAKAIRVET